MVAEVALAKSAYLIDRPACVRRSACFISQPVSLQGLGRRVARGLTLSNAQPPGKQDIGSPDLRASVTLRRFRGLRKISVLMPSGFAPEGAKSFHTDQVFFARCGWLPRQSETPRASRAYARESYRSVSLARQSVAPPSADATALPMGGIIVGSKARGRLGK